jgi:hypothetical protein
MSERRLRSQCTTTGSIATAGSAATAGSVAVAVAGVTQLDSASPGGATDGVLRAASSGQSVLVCGGDFFGDAHSPGVDQDLTQLVDVECIETDTHPLVAHVGGTRHEELGGL